MSESPIGTSGEHDRAASRRRVLRVVRASTEGSSVHHIAEQTGLHPNTVRFHLDRLVDERLISRRTRRTAGPGRPPLTFTATPAQEAVEEYREFASLALILADLITQISPDPVAAAIQAGRARGLIDTEAAPGPWGATEAISALTAALTERGFATESAAEDSNARTLMLHRHCPFLEVAQVHQNIICSVHLGLMRGTLERMNAPVIVESLTPFASPAGCETRLFSRSA